MNELMSRSSFIEVSLQGRRPFTVLDPLRLLRSKYSASMKDSDDVQD